MIVSQLASVTVSKVQSGELDPVDVLQAYGKKAIHAHNATNCLTEILLPEAEQWAKQCNRQGPLAGMPVSFKDTVGVAGWDACIGYSAWVGMPVKKDSGLVRLLRDAGAVPFVKTNVPITLLSLESSNDVFGRCTNPHSKNYAAGGSSGGEAALLAFGGSRLGIGTDVAGSVRGPACVFFLCVGDASLNMLGFLGIILVFIPSKRPCIGSRRLVMAQAFLDRLAFLLYILL
jgi:Asp-tRNA(Asn)/Glu-tRNA(Gln) amidotransferase A subunit family amidase